MGQVIRPSDLGKLLGKLRRQKKKIVFTNGCFDLLHIGHVRYLKKAGKMGDILIVGLNSDSSVRKLKGQGRPILPQADRAEILAALEPVDYVVIFNQATPLDLIKKIKPNILVKGGDYRVDNIVGAGFVRSYEGKIVAVPLVKGKSTNLVIASILRRYQRSQHSA